MLSIVATPIGNLEDITLRAIRTLKESDIVVAEDTRHSGILLKHFGIQAPMRSFHSHSSETDLANLTALLVSGKHLALIADAGTPGISDPAYRLIQAALEHRIPITSIPGPTASINALVLSGLPMHRFLFLGFLPLKKGRKKLLESLKENPYTIVIYEAPHRIRKTLAELETALGNRSIAVCREMTKMFEEVLRMPINEAQKHFSEKNPKGEFTLVIGPPERNSGRSDIIES